MPTSLNLKIRDLRRKCNWSLDRLAAETGMSKSYLWELENRDISNPSAEKLSNIADALGVTLDFLLDDGADQPSEAVFKNAFFRKFDRLDPDAKKRVEDIVDLWSRKSEDTENT